MRNELILQSTNDIPFVECMVNIHQPTINEISIIGEDSFRTGLSFLNFTKSQLSEEDQASLFDKDDFEIFMTIMVDKNRPKYKMDTMFVFALLFPEYEIHMKQEGIELVKGDFTTLIDKDKYELFKDIINTMFRNSDVESTGKYNPADRRAAKIAEKLSKRKAKKAEDNIENLEHISVYGRYVSILSVALQKDKNELMGYTIPQLLDEFERYQLKQSFDIYIQAKMAGAQDLDEVENWMKELHP